MDKEQFKNRVVASILNYLPNDFKKAEVRFETITKDNSIKKEALIIDKWCKGSLPHFYIEPFYFEHLKGTDLVEILKSLAALIIRGYEEAEQITVEAIEYKKENIVFRVVNRETNKHLIGKIPHRVHDDLLIFYTNIAFFKGDVMGRKIITKENLHLYNTTEEELENLAMENTQRLFPPVLESMKEIIDNITNMKKVRVSNLLLTSDAIKNEDYYLLTNEKRKFGSSVLFYEGLLEKLSVLLGNNFYIIPSNIDEVLLIPGIPAVDLEYLKQVHFSDKNNTESLTQSIYYYDSNEKTFRIIC
jgi:hypothetical protein